MIIKKPNGKYQVKVVIQDGVEDIGEFDDKATALKEYKKNFKLYNGCKAKTPEYYEWQLITEYQLVRVK